MAPYDQAIVHAVRSGATPALTSIALAVTFFGSVIGVTLLTVVSLLFLAYRHRWVTLSLVFSCSALSALIMDFAKTEVHRPRPDLLLALVTEPGFSYPSGHSMCSTSFYGALLLIVLPRLRKPWQRVGATLSYFAFIASIGWSRIYLGAHYPSDVFGGFCLGIAWLSTCFVLYTVSLQRLKRYERR